MSDTLVNIGPASAAAVIFALLVAWCFSHRRVDRSLAALGLYLGLLDGYLKLSTGSPVITLARDVLVAAIAGGALLRAMGSHQRLPLPPMGALVLVFSAVVIVELFNPDAPSLIAGAAGVRQHLEFVPLFFLGYVFMRRETQIRKLMFVLLICAAIGGVVSYVQSTLTPQELAGWGPGYSERILGTGRFAGAPRVAYGEAGATSVRPFGLGSDLGAGAVAAALALPAFIAMMLVTKGWLRAWLVPLGIGIGLAVATSGTRAALVAVFVSAASFGLIAASSGNARRVIAGLAVGAILVYGAFEYLGPSNSTAERAQSIAPGKALTTFSQERGSSVALFAEYASDYPLGLGVGTVGPAAAGLSDRRLATQLNTETQWNFLILEVGVFGLALFVALNLRLMALALTRIRRIADDTLRLQLAALAAPLFGLLVQGFAGPTTATVPASPYFWFVAGVLSYWVATLGREAPAEHARLRARAEPRSAQRPLPAREVAHSSTVRLG
ncbi:MAG: hypothetical protein WKF96_17150 [Solirubrobacteraceae bacterium]